MTNTEYKDFMKWYQETNPTADQMNDYWKVKKVKAKKIDCCFAGLGEEDYQGLGNGNYTMEEFDSYELKAI